MRYHVPVSDGAITSAMLMMMEMGIGKMKLVVCSWALEHHTACNLCVVRHHVTMPDGG